MGFSWIRAVTAATLLALAPGAAFAGALFDATSPDTDLHAFPFWQAVLADTPRDGACNDMRHCAPKSWTDFLATARKLDAPARLDAVNRWVNSHPHVEDAANWGVPDYWETPGEFIARGGDCEDFAVAKYFSLIRLGFAQRDLRIVVVSDTGSFHAVVAVHTGDNTLVLDDQVADVTSLKAQPRYVPVYSLGEQGWWLHSAPVIHAKGGTLVAASESPRAIATN